MRLLKISLLLATVAIITGAVMFTGCATFGMVPRGDDLSRMEASPQYNKDTGMFENPVPGVLETMRENSTDLEGIWKWFFMDGDRTPDGPLPRAAPDMAAWADDDGAARAVWFGHSSLLVRMGGRNVLIDPMFSGYASPVRPFVKRFQEPALGLEELPKIDFIVISHDHYDHLDMDTVRHFSGGSVEFLVPLGVGSHLERWGVEPGRIIELDWWESAQRGGLRFTAAPAQHFSGRSFLNQNKTLWASWVISGGGCRVYFSGDSGYGPHFREIGQKYGPFDLAFIETGQYDERWRNIHMMPEDGAQAYFDLRARAYFPVHWGMFKLSLHAWYQPAEDILEQAVARGVNLITPMMGQVVDVSRASARERWWRRSAMGANADAMRLARQED